MAAWVGCGRRADIISNLQTDILRLQGHKTLSNNAIAIKPGIIKEAFPNSSFLFGAVHEFVSTSIEDAAATTGFVAGFIKTLFTHEATLLWISSSRKVYPPALKLFDIEPDRVIFIDLPQEKHVLWAMEEALKCHALSAVVGEVKNLSFTASRRLQLAVEQSHVNGFVLRKNITKLNTTACVSRWKVTSLKSEPIGNLPGIGYPTWRVELVRIKNGRPNIWEVKWMNGNFVSVHSDQASYHTTIKKAG